MLADKPIRSASAPATSWLRLSLLSPLLLLALAILACALLLTQPLVLPLGAMYWDLVLYLDAANRIAGGQQPILDFVTPVGPLGYWLFAGLDRLFDQGHPLLLAQWSTLLITAPPMALILYRVDRRSRAAAFGLLLPFLVFQLLPINVEQYSFYPGMDGFGIYNRQVSIVLYVLVAALLFLQDRRLVAGVLVWTLLALLMIKITGFLAGGLIAAFALLAGRLGWRYALAAAAVAALLLAGLELASGLVSAYVDSILGLVALNVGTILPRFLQAASLHLDVVAAGTALIVTLALLQRRDMIRSVVACLRAPNAGHVAQIFDRDWLWIGVVMAAGLFFETQNTGGQAFIFLWPVLLTVLLAWTGHKGRGTFVVLALLALTAIPPMESVLKRAGRSLLAQSGYQTLPAQHLGRLGLVSQHRQVLDVAGDMQTIYASHTETFRAIADLRMLPSLSFYSTREFQVGWLMAVDAGIAAIRDYEAANGVRFETIMSLNFVNPFPYLMGRSGVRHIPIGADPFRAVPAMDERAREAVSEADLILYPRCPVTVANDALLDIYRPAMTNRSEIALGPCWTGYVKQR